MSLDRRTPMPRGKGLERRTELGPGTGPGLTRSGPIARVAPMPVRSRDTPDAPRPAPASSRAQDTPEPVKRKVRALWDDLCACCGAPAPQGDREHHHRRPRGMGGRPADEAHRLSALVLLRKRCHEHWESHRDDARERGLLVPHGIDPAEWPVHAWDGVWLLDDLGDRHTYRLAA